MLVNSQVVRIFLDFEEVTAHPPAKQSWQVIRRPEDAPSQAGAVSELHPRAARAPTTCPEPVRLNCFHVLSYVLIGRGWRWYGGYSMKTLTGKRTARVSLTLNKRNVEALEPADKPFIAWDDKLMGFGVRVQLSGIKSFLVNYRTGDGGRKAPNKRVVIGRFGRVALSRRLGVASAQCHRAPRGRGALHPAHREARLGDRQSGDLAPALRLPPILCRSRGAAQPGRSVAGGGWAVQPGHSAGDLCSHLTGGRKEVLVPRLPQLLDHGRRPRVDDPA